MLPAVRCLLTLSAWVTPVSILFLGAICSLETASAGYVKQTIQNTSTDAAGRDDLIAVFTGTASLASVTLKNGATEVTVTPTTTGPFQQTATFKAGSFGTVGPGGKVSITTFTNFLNGASISTSKSKWSLGKDELNTVETVGDRINYKAKPKDAVEGFFTFDDPSDANSAVVYTNIQLFVNNSISNYTINQFQTPTGTAVSLSPVSPCTLTSPDSITLIPGQSCSFDIGPVDPGGYELALADVATVVDPTNTFPLATAELAAAGLPEPSTLSVLGIATLGLVGRFFRRNTRVHR
jgi:hypothetical protein